jgi:hypothetical protein
MWAAHSGRSNLCKLLIRTFCASPRVMDTRRHVARTIAQRAGHITTADRLAKLAAEALVVREARAPASIYREGVLRVVAGAMAEAVEWSTNDNHGTLRSYLQSPFFSGLLLLKQRINKHMLLLELLLPM